MKKFHFQSYGLSYIITNQPCLLAASVSQSQAQSSQSQQHNMATYIAVKWPDF